MRRKKKQFVPRPRTAAPTERMDGLPCPNHNIGVDVTQKGLGGTDIPSYPILNLALPDAVGSGRADRLAFFAKIHKLAHWTDTHRYLELCEDCCEANSLKFATVPPTPTWMDPIVYIMMLERNEQAQAAIAAYARKPSPQNKAALAAELTQMLETAYRLFVEKKFEEMLPEFMRWLAANFLQTESDRRVSASKPYRGDAPHPGKPPAVNKPAPTGGRVPLPRFRKPG